MPFFCMGGLKNAILLYGGVSKMPFFCIGGSRKSAKFLPPLPIFKWNSPYRMCIDNVYINYVEKEGCDSLVVVLIVGFGCCE